ncbi:Bifunctional purine biosynthesis protein PurH [Diplodia seriata]|uniref:Bifunctional purine biosynthesis protein PurH n=1 Tax=Diplodia seriata TaxID=420778 RepID=A0ABR3C2S3_9PEZI
MVFSAYPLYALGEHGIDNSLGINTIIMYGVSLLSTLLSANSALLNLFVSAVNIVVTTGCAPLIERLGRKTCLISSIAGMGTSALLLGISIIRVIPILSIIAVVAFVSSFALGLGPVPFILASELVGPNAVGATQSWALAANWIATFVVAQFFPILNAKMGGYVFFIFTALAVGFGAFVALVVPETKGKKDADEVWGRHPARRED